MDRPEVLEIADETVEEKLLRLIEQGDATVILSPEYITGLNELMKLELIAIEDDRLMLTEKGKLAQIQGIKSAPQLTTEEEEDMITNFTSKSSKAVISNRNFFIILFFFLVSLLLTLAFLNTPFN